ncbi:MAG: TIGR03619 family F420-dependent LLM class oxidoreductase [SAR86 cluster bacterium]|jgi:probable F420-dependent oxidoreductase|uniref:TIGR03619 family F420-dependent LLM class oxidoreductase n=1 Tax=SAR86 cluster bacterium TaxID=2030880 RepID=A0A972VXS4_9GAMM|nr:TIGR03619 family F420-dependent LLM class oxidoreductase [SAR86 cluster bacterium]
MKFTYHHSMCPPEQYAPLAIEAERLGFDTITMPESICYPKHATSQYPYNEDGGRDFLDNEPFIDPFILTAHMAAVTQQIRFSTSIIKLAIRQPVLVAKSLASLAVITNNRFACGVGISPWKEDFEVAQIPWEKRGQRLDETIDIVRGLMSGEYFGYQGDIFDIPEIKLCPVPTAPLPILVGGHADAALKRAARRGDGWIAAGASLEELSRMIKRVHELRRDYGRDHLPFEIHTSSDQAYSSDGVKRLEEIGVTEVTVAFRNIYAGEPDTQSVAEKIATLNWYAKNVMAKSRL